MSTIDGARLTDKIEQFAEYHRPGVDGLYLRGFGTARLFGPDGQLKQLVEFENLITEVGDQYYGDRAAAIGSIAAVTGMQLGTGSTTPAKTGAGAAMVTVGTGSTPLVALTGGYPQSSLVSTKRRISYRVTWAAGVATQNSLNEVVLTNQSTGTQTAVPAANCISRALLSPVVNKAAGDSLQVDWHHELLGA